MYPLQLKPEHRTKAKLHKHLISSYKLMTKALNESNNGPVFSLLT